MNKCNNTVDDDNILKVKCSITSEDNSTIYLYYKNQTEGFVLIDTFNFDGSGINNFSMFITIDQLNLFSLLLISLF